MYKFLVQSTRGLKANLPNNEVAYPDRSWGSARVGIFTNMKDVRVIDKGRGKIHFITGDMLETDEIKKSDVSDVFLNSFDIDTINSVKFYVEEGKNGFILFLDSSGIMWCYVKINGVLVGLRLDESTHKILFGTISFRGYHHYSSDYILESKEKQMEAFVHVFDSANSTLEVGKFQIDIYNNRYIVYNSFGDDRGRYKQKRYYLYNKVLGKVTNSYYLDESEFDSETKVTYTSDDLFKYMIENNIMVHKFDVSTSEVLLKYMIKTNSGADFYEIEAFDSRQFRVEMLDDADLVAYVADSVEGYKKQVARCKKQLTVNNLGEFRKCILLSEVFGCVIRDHF